MTDPTTTGAEIVGDLERMETLAAELVDLGQAVQAKMATLAQATGKPHLNPRNLLAHWLDDVIGRLLDAHKARKAAPGTVNVSPAEVYKRALAALEQ